MCVCVCVYAGTLYTALDQMKSCKSERTSFGLVSFQSITFISHQPSDFVLLVKFIQVGIFFSLVLYCSLPSFLPLPSFLSFFAFFVFCSLSSSVLPRPKVGAGCLVVSYWELIVYSPSPSPCPYFICFHLQRREYYAHICSSIT